MLGGSGWEAWGWAWGWGWFCLGLSEFDVGRFCLSLSEFNVGRFCLSLSELYVGFSCLVRVGRSRLGLGVVLPSFALVICWSFLLSSISPCAGRHFISLSNGDKETEAKKTPTDASA